MQPQTCFALVVRPTPHVLPRIFDLLARQGIVPAHCHTRLEPPAEFGGEPTMTVDLQLGPLDGRLAARLATGLAALVEVDDLLEGATCAAA